MTTETSSIDDVLAGNSQEYEQEPEVPETSDYEPEEPEHEPDAPEEPEDAPESGNDSGDDDGLDDYGNEKPKKESKTYTEDEVNERINKAVRDRLARMKPAQQPTQQQQQQATDAGFEYNPDSNMDWQQQLKQFIRQTNEEVVREQQQRQYQQREQQIQQEFEEKFHRGMSKFQDFHDVVATQPITDAMTIATRTMKDPAAFIYAASKRHAKELERISQIPDQYAQIAEMGRLEERMRKGKAATKAPRPLGQTREDSTIKHKEENTQPSIEDLMMAADNRKLKNMRARRS